MKLTLHLSAGLPGDNETTASVAGDVLCVDGVEYDLSAVPEGGRAAPQGEHPFSGAITRIDGVIHADLVWSYDGATAAPDQGTEHPTVEITQGPVSDPVLRSKEAAA